jgi:hypothetical protein
MRTVTRMNTRHRTTALTTTLVALLATALLAPAHATAAVAAPPVTGACWDYNAAQAEQGAGGRAVECAEDHTAETFSVAPLPGGFLNPKKASAQKVGQEIARNCTVEKMNEYLGVSQELPLRTRMFASLPNAKQWRAGERWVRCDVAMRSGSGLQTWSGPLPELVAASPAGTFHYCMSIYEPTATAQPCASPGGQWILVANKKLGEPETTYAGLRAVGFAAKDLCAPYKDIYHGGKSRTDQNGWWATSPRVTDWNRGERNASCFVPLDQYNATLSTPQPVEVEEDYYPDEEVTDPTEDDLANDPRYWHPSRVGTNPFTKKNKLVISMEVEGGRMGLQHKVAGVWETQHVWEEGMGVTRTRFPARAGEWRIVSLKPTNEAYEVFLDFTLKKIGKNKWRYQRNPETFGNSWTPA